MLPDDSTPRDTGHVSNFAMRSMIDPGTRAMPARPPKALMIQADTIQREDAMFEGLQIERD